MRCQLPCILLTEEVATIVADATATYEELSDDFNITENTALSGVMSIFSSISELITTSVFTTANKFKSCRTTITILTTEKRKRVSYVIQSLWRWSVLDMIEPGTYRNNRIWKRNDEQMPSVPAGEMLAATQIDSPANIDFIKKMIWYRVEIWIALVKKRV